MDIITFGWTEYITKHPEYLREDVSVFARVAAQNKTNYVLFSSYGELEGIMRGNALKEAKKDGSYPKVGDWVRIEKLQGELKAVITEILPRLSTVARTEGEHKKTQIIATNVDVLFIVQSLDNNFNLARLERYLLLARDAGSKPVIILNKSDMVSNAQEYVSSVQAIAPRTEILLVSAGHGTGLEPIKAHILPGITVAFVGSSGVGKSTIINKLMGNEAQATGEVREEDSKGRHTTTRRDLVLLPGGGMIIDTPGMRELGIAATVESTEDVYADITELAKQCEFANCDHQKSSGCAVRAALRNGTLERKRYESFLKMTTSQQPKRSKSEIEVAQRRKQKEKQLHKRLYKRLHEKYD